jgi:hypothetical protein
VSQSTEKQSMNLFDTVLEQVLLQLKESLSRFEHEPEYLEVVKCFTCAVQVDAQNQKSLVNYL